ncbi:hypothetical protein KY332_04540 [Candidatus Woesearchaeota archaeon]|nr:hypothetical protein [Candidatus Woesearchaeota archaeon]
MTDTIIKRKMEKNYKEVTGRKIAKGVYCIKHYNTPEIRQRTIEIIDPSEEYEMEIAGLTSDEKRNLDKEIIKCARELGLTKRDVMEYVPLGLEEALNTLYKPGVIGEGDLRPGFRWEGLNAINRVLPD